MDEHIREIIDEAIYEHLSEELPRTMGELNEFHELAGKLAGKVHRRTQAVKKHMMFCETCINRQMQLGLLMPIEEFYEQGQMMGLGRLPKVHYMVN